LNITLYETDQFFSDLRAEWPDLLGSSTANLIFMSHEWQETWWDTYHPGKLWALVLRDESGRCIGLAPWFIGNDNGRRIVCPVGCVDVTDYLDVIVRRGAERAVFEALAAWLDEHSESFDAVSLRNIPQGSPTLSLLSALAELRGFDVQTAVDDVCPIILLPATFEEYLAGLSKKNRHELRRKLRRATGQAEWYIVNETHDLKAETETFLSLMAASTPDKAAFLADPQNIAFFRRIIPVMAERGCLQLALMTVQSEPAAAYLNFDYGGRVMVYNSGLNPNMGGQFSPGIVLLARLIEHAIEQGYALFDLLRGDEPYKYDLGGQNTEIYRLDIRRS